MDTITTAPEPVQPFPVKQEAAARAALASMFDDAKTPISEETLLACPRTPGVADSSFVYAVYGTTPRGRLLLRPFIEAEPQRDGYPGLPVPTGLEAGEATILNKGSTTQTDYIAHALKVAKALQSPTKWLGEKDKTVRIDHRVDVMRIRTADLLFLIAPRISEGA